MAGLARAKHRTHHLAGRNAEAMVFREAAEMAEEGRAFQIQHQHILVAGGELESGALLVPVPELTHRVQAPVPGVTEPQVRGYLEGLGFHRPYGGRVSGVQRYGGEGPRLAERRASDGGASFGAKRDLQRPRGYVFAVHHAAMGDLTKRMGVPCRSGPGSGEESPLEKRLSS